MKKCVERVALGQIFRDDVDQVFSLSFSNSSVRQTPLWCAKKNKNWQETREKTIGVVLQQYTDYKCPHSRPCYFLSTNWPTVWVLSHCRASSHTGQFPLFFFQTTKRT